MFETYLILKGVKFDNIVIEFDKSIVSDAHRIEEAYGKKIDNSIKLYNQGVIDNDGVANYVGYDAPDKDEPREVQIPKESKPRGIKQNDPTGIKKEYNEY
jgi:hypothetical protein